MNFLTKQLCLISFLISPHLLASPSQCLSWTLLDQNTKCVASMYQVIPNMADFQDMELRLTGVLHIEFERHLLFIDEFSFKEKVYPNSINLAIVIENLDSITYLHGEVVDVYGEFKKLKDGFYYLVNIREINNKDKGTVLFDDSKGTTKAIVLKHEKNSNQ